MRGEPLRICSVDHPTIIYTSPEACPICTLRTRVAELERALAAAAVATKKES